MNLLNKTFKIHTLGCKTNQLESAVINSALVNAGYKEQVERFEANIHIINSCTVTNKADNEVLSLARRIKNTNNGAYIVVTGCFAQVASGALSNIPEFDLILGNNEKLNIVKYIDNITVKTVVSDILACDEFINYDFIESGRTRASLKVQDGCNNRCAYCIIPYARGKSRSNTLENITDQVNKLISKEYKEIVLTGIHLGQWGSDFNNCNSLLNLLKNLESITNMPRYRLSSLDPTEFSLDLIEFLVSSQKVCNHFHISLQSANNKIITLMNRKYTFEVYKKLVLNLTCSMPFTSIGNDVIVGFPGETDEDFEITYNNLASLPISYVHVFPYSKRKGTPASDMPYQVDEKIKKLRAEKLKTLSNEKNLIFKQSLINTVQEVLIEKKPDKKTLMLKGITKNYVNVLIDTNTDISNQIKTIKIIDFNNNNLIGKIE